MLEEHSTQVYEAVERELGRTAYPEGFPSPLEIPLARYTDPQFHQLEMTYLWPRTWLHAGHVNEIAEQGSYKLFTQLGQSIIVTRGIDGEIRAFHNVCRHRASALVEKTQGKVRRFTCPYHAWTYGLDGKLIAVPEQERSFDCLNKAERGLMPVRCETMRGMIYLNLDGNALPLSQYFASTERELGDFPLEKMVVKDILTIDMGCNWKAAYDNFLEPYHVDTLHAKSIAPYLNNQSFVNSLFKLGHGRFVTRKRGANTFFGEDMVVPDAPSTLFQDHTIGLPMFPNSFVAIDPVAFAWETWWPVSHNKSVMIVTLLGWEDQDEVFWESMTEKIKSIAAEDVYLFPSLQRSYESGVTSSALLAYQEQQLYWYQEEIDRQIGVENIPEHLRIKPLLASHVKD